MRAAIRIGIIMGTWLVLPLHAQQGVGDYRGLPTDLAAAATAYDIAQNRADRAGLERYLADDYTLANVDGSNQTRAQCIAGLMTPGHSTSYVAISDQVSKVWSDGAVLAGIVDARGSEHGKPTALHARFVDVWARRHGQWQVIYTQIQAMPIGH